MKILLSGGGTMGSVSPLLAIVDEMRRFRPGIDEFLWIGTANGPEKKVIENYQITFIPIFCGKFRRYFSLNNFFDIFRIIFGVHQSKKILRDFHPNLILTAGSFVCYPVARAAEKLHIPYFVHQQDVLPGLTNKLLAKNAALITVTLDESLAHFPSGKTIVTGNPVRDEMSRGDKELARDVFDLKETIPTLLFMGGGTGAQALNELLVKALPELTKNYQIIHLTGEGKEIAIEKLPTLPPFQGARYKQYGFIADNMKHAYALADLVICRASFSTISELSMLGKSAVLIPIPDSHQVDNAMWLKKNNSAFLLDQKKLTPEKLTASINTLFSYPNEMHVVSVNITQIMKKDVDKAMVREIVEFVGR